MDYSNPFTPIELYRETQRTFGVFVKDSMVYVATGGAEYQLNIINAVNLAAPTTLSSVMIPSISSGIDVDVEYCNNFVYYSPGYDVSAVDISNVYSPQVMGRFELYLGLNIATYDKFVLLCDLIYGLKILQNNLITSLQELPIRKPQEFHLVQNYPNPFNPSTVISFQLPVSSYVTLKVYDVFGKEVTTMLNEKMDAGEHEVEWNAENYASGVYSYKLSAGSVTQVKKMLLMR